VSDDPQPEDPCSDEYFELAGKRRGDEYFNIEELEVE
jgi:hypothetical protein